MNKEVDAALFTPAMIKFGLFVLLKFFSLRGKGR